MATPQAAIIMLVLDAIGLPEVSNVAISLALLPAAPVGYRLGLKLLKRLPAPFNLALAVAMRRTGRPLATLSCWPESLQWRGIGRRREAVGRPGFVYLSD